MREFYFSSLVSPEFFTFHISFSVYLFPLRFHYRGERKSINTFPSLPGNLLIRIIQFIRCIFFFFFSHVATGNSIAKLSASTESDLSSCYQQLSLCFPLGLLEGPQASTDTPLKVLPAASSSKHAMENEGSGARSCRAL